LLAFSFFRDLIVFVRQSPSCLKHPIKPVADCYG